MSARGDMGRAHRPRQGCGAGGPPQARDGYLVVREFLDAGEVAGLLEWTTELEEAPEVSGGHWVYREESVTTTRQRVIQRIET